MVTDPVYGTGFDLPDDFLAAKSIARTDVWGSLLVWLAPDQFALQKQQCAYVDAFTVIGERIYLMSSLTTDADSGTAYSMIYWAKLPPFTEIAANWVSRNTPRLYKDGCASLAFEEQHNHPMRARFFAQFVSGVNQINLRFSDMSVIGGGVINRPLV